MKVLAQDGYRVDQETVKSAASAAQALQTSLRARDSAVIVAICPYLLREPGSEDLLIAGLNAANAEFDKPSTERKLDQDAGHMATSFLHSGDSILESAAKKWAHARGYHIVLMPSGHIIE